MKLSVIVPCYNEAKTIELIINKILNLKSINKEIIVVDDFSEDGTKEILNKLNHSEIKIIHNNINYGKGYSVRKGIEVANGDIIIIQDADLEYDPTDYEAMINPIVKGYADAVFGSRFLGSQEHRVLYFWHRLGNSFLTLFSNIFQI